MITRLTYSILCNLAIVAYANCRSTFSAKPTEQFYLLKLLLCITLTCSICWLENNFCSFLASSYLTMNGSILKEVSIFAFFLALLFPSVPNVKRFLPV